MYTHTTTEQFFRFMQGAVEMIGDVPTPEQWAAIKAKLADVAIWPANTVFNGSRAATNENGEHVTVTFAALVPGDRITPNQHLSGREYLDEPMNIVIDSPAH